MNTFKSSVHITSADTPLAKASALAKPRVREAGKLYLDRHCVGYYCENLGHWAKREGPKC